MTAKEVVDARKTRIDADEAWELLKLAKSVTVTGGQKTQHFESVADNKDIILKNVMGPSGNLRAPTYRVKDQFMVGFNAHLYGEWIK